MMVWLAFAAGLSAGVLATLLAQAALARRREARLDQEWDPY